MLFVGQWFSVPQLSVSLLTFCSHIDAADLSPDVVALKAYITQFRQLNVDITELSCLKAIALFRRGQLSAAKVISDLLHLYLVLT